MIDYDSPSFFTIEICSRYGILIALLSMEVTTMEMVGWKQKRKAYHAENLEQAESNEKVEASVQRRFKAMNSII
jgi:hypothetical protein